MPGGGGDEQRRCIRGLEFRVLWRELIAHHHHEEEHGETLLQVSVFIQEWGCGGLGHLCFFPIVFGYHSVISNCRACCHRRRPSARLQKEKQIMSNPYKKYAPFASRVS
ncbi:unnamed protein product [Discosporangium mesarthrocarpum]